MDPGELVIVFAKPAVPGSVKTRLIPPLTPAQAAEFHLAALTDVIAIAKAVAAGRVELWIAVGGEELERYRHLYKDVIVRSQQGEDLGARLADAFQASFARGGERVAIVGSDHPTLPVEYLREALSRLADHDVALGPSRDGGYYAVAVRSSSWPPAAALFRSVPWSTSAVLEVTLERAREAQLAVWLAPEWYDVDEPDDLDSLRADAKQDSAAAGYLRRLERNES